MAEAALQLGSGPREAADTKNALAMEAIADGQDRRNPRSKAAWQGKHDNDRETEPMQTRPSMATNTSEANVGRVRWEWEHRTGFKPYSKNESDRIESHFQTGAWMMRMKSGVGAKAKPREIYFYDMVQFNPSSESGDRKIRRVPEPSLYCRLRRHVLSMADAFFAGDAYWWRPKTKAFFERRRDLEGDDEDLQEEMYLTDSRAYKIVGHWIFGVVRYLMIIANAFYIWADADYNDGATYSDTEVVFVVFDNIFTVWFLIEAVIMWFAFRNLRMALRDSWFVFDILLVVLMVLETWVLQLVVFIFVGDGQAAELNKLSLLRVVRLLRLARIVRLFKIFPQLIVLMKGMFLAMKSLFYTLLLLFVLTCVCAIVFKNFSDLNDGLKALKYDTVGNAFWNLLAYGAFLDNLEGALGDLKDLHIGYAMFMLAYIFMSNLTMLNMLIGVLCEVIARVSDAEANEAAEAELKESITEILECYDVEDDHLLKLSEFDALMKNPDLKVILQTHAIDHADLLKLQDVLFHERVHPDGTKSMPQIKFPAFLEKVLQLRGGNTARVGDVVELRTFLQARLAILEARLSRQRRVLESAVAAGTVAEGSSAALSKKAPVSLLEDAPPPLPGQVQTPKMSTVGEGSSPSSSSPQRSPEFCAAVTAQLAEIRTHQDALRGGLTALQTQMQELQALPAQSTEV